MMTMLGFGTRGRCKTKFRRVARGEIKGAEADEKGNKDLKRKLWGRVTILFVT